MVNIGRRRFLTLAGGTEHYLGTLRGVRGFGDPHPAVHLSGGLTISVPGTAWRRTFAGHLENGRASVSDPTSRASFVTGLELYVYGGSLAR